MEVNMNKRRRIIAFIGVLLGMSNSMIMQTILTTSLPVISEEFKTVAYYSWVYSGYMLASTVTIPLFGKVCDKFGYRKNYLIGGMLFFLGTLGCGICNSMQTLVASRIIMGLGSGIVVPATYGILGVIFKKEEMTKVFAFIAIFQIINNGLGSFLGGLFTTYFTWRYGMFLLIPIEIIGFVVVLMTIEDNQNMKSDDILDIKGAIFFSISLLLIMYGLEKCSESLLNKNIVFLIAGLALLIICLLVDSKKEKGILPQEVKKSKVLRGLLLEVMLTGSILNICLAYLPTYMVRELSIDSSRTGKLLIIYLVTMGIASLGAACIKIDGIKLISYGWFSILIGGIFGFVSFLVYPFVFFIIATFFLGLGVGILSATVMGRMQKEISKNRASTNGLAHLIRNFGGTLGVAALQVSLLNGMKILFAAIFIIAVIAFLIQLMVNKKSIQEAE